MSSDEKVLDFPRVEVTPEENARRVTVEATRLASLAPGEWRLWIDRSAERLRIPRATLQGLIVAINSVKRRGTQRLQPDGKNLRFDVSKSATNANRSESTGGPNTNARKKRKHSKA
jgi:hypothetical protein